MQQHLRTVLMLRHSATRADQFKGKLELSIFFLDEFYPYVPLVSLADVVRSPRSLIGSSLGRCAIFR